MRGQRYESVHEWIAECRALVRRDKDDLILVTGPEGEGKSTIAFQVAKALDPGFNVGRVSFGIQAFLKNAPKTPKFGAVLADELLANKRKAMYGETIELLDFLQICRGLNLHLLICFPHLDLFEGAILNYRVRWRIHVPKRGVFVLYERASKTLRGKWGQEKTVASWRVRGAWTFRENEGPIWDEYLLAKHNHMRGRGVDVEAQPDTVELEDVGFDVEELRVAFVKLREAGAKKAKAPKAAIREKASAGS